MTNCLNEEVVAGERRVSLPANQPEPWHSPWPDSELEQVKTCPVCGSGDRSLLHDDLVDNVFFVAPGRWTLFSCECCRGAYLDPRPTEASIGKAYAAYYTHESTDSSQVAFEDLGWLRRIRRRLANGYQNSQFGTQCKPESSWGKCAAFLFPKWRSEVEANFRFLPKPMPGQRLLDIGCGNGAFLQIAKSAGWNVSGLELDERAAAIQRGFDVRIGTIGLFAEESECFDAITLSHVIEHVHDPIKLIRDIYRLLKPNGVVYIQTPNIESDGARIFGRHWRGLEPPRHLFLFNLLGLTQALSKGGFGKICFKQQKMAANYLFLNSLRIAGGVSPYGAYPAQIPIYMRWKLKLRLMFLPHCREEFITLTATKVIA